MAVNPLQLRTVPTRASRVETLKRAYGAIGRADTEAFVSVLTPDCRFRLVGNPATNPYCGVRIGREAVRQVMAMLFASYTIEDFLIESIVMDGDSAAVRWTVSVSSHKSSQLLELERFDHVTFRDHQVHEVVGFFDTATIAVVSGRLQMPGV